MGYHENGGPGPRAARFCYEGGEYAYVSFASRPFARPAGLTEAEAGVVELVLRGASSDEIARARGVSPRTVANQLASVYRKLGVSSRTALVRALTGGDAPSGG